MKIKINIFDVCIFILSVILFFKITASLLLSGIFSICFGYFMITFISIREMLKRILHISI